MVVTGKKWWPRIGVLATAMVFLVSGSQMLRADEKEDPLRSELLKLNAVSNEKDQISQLRTFIKDREKAKKTVMFAAKMMKEAKGDEKPFNYNGTLILARAAYFLKLYDIAEKFSERQVELATKSKNGTKIVSAYEGLIDLYWTAKRYNDVIETCEKVVDLKGPMEVLEMQPFAFEKLIQAKAKQGKIEEALTLTKGLLELYEDAWYFLQIKAWVQREDGKLKDAIATYHEVLEKIDAMKVDEDKQKAKEKIKDSVRYTLSGVYVENKELDKAAD